MAIAALAVVTSRYAPRMSNVVFILMVALRPIGDHIERGHAEKAIAAAQAA